eukprot:gnl/MRDRNA2_/MRDRNA2_80985_c0_seq4.p1 gnl/MRDRNA2_/MRDRNA2_80985_c0~~gnl/MRDRNA2_/MRDRNA2_80985_c0_seq4.p1  ORF type:complete len:284 (+),score=55.82 gnl/MRDRNA2_/MRDRNA2_80985_c0_seq4:23-853(+)
MEAAILLAQICEECGSELQIVAACATASRQLRWEIARCTNGREIEVVTPQLLEDEDEDFTPRAKVLPPWVPPDIVESAPSNYQTPPTVAKRLIKKSQSAGRYVLPPGMSIEVVLTEPEDALTTLQEVIQIEDAALSLLFVNTQLKVDNEIDQLRQSGVDAMAVEGAVLQQKEIAPPAVNAKEEARSRVLVAHPRDARGLDLHGVDLVIIQYVPKSADAFLHMAGRTARMGANGRVIMLTTEEEADKNLKILSTNLGYNLLVKRVRVRNGKAIEQWR